MISLNIYGIYRNFKSKFEMSTIDYFNLFYDVFSLNTTSKVLDYVSFINPKYEVEISCFIKKYLIL